MPSLFAQRGPVSKTIIFSHIIKRLKGIDKKCIVLAHRKELISQAVEKIKLTTGIQADVFCASLGQKNLGDVTVASVQSLARYKGELDFDVLIVDEAHRIPPMDKDSQYASVLNRMKGRVIGVTATPYRMDNGYIHGSEGWFNQVDFEISIQELIDNGYLCDFKHKVIKKINLKGVRKLGNDYNQGQLQDVMIKQIHLDSVQKAIVEHASDRKSIVIFCTGITHAKMIHEMVGGEIVYHGCDDREGALLRFASGQSRFIINVDILTEGWDCPRVDCVVMARPTKSAGLYVQMAGRGLRPYDGKPDCLFLDLSNNGIDHGLITSIEVEAKGKGKGKGEAEDKICPECFELNPPGSRICSSCGFSMIEDIEVEEINEQQKMIELKADTWTAVTGYAEFYKSKSGNKCVRLNVTLENGTENKYLTLYYPFNYGDIKKRLGRIVSRFTDYRRSEVEPEKFIRGVNSGKLFPINNVEFYKDSNGYGKIRGFG